jgi:hypothetical protein
MRQLLTLLLLLALCGCTKAQTGVLGAATYASYTPVTDETVLGQWDMNNSTANGTGGASATLSGGTLSAGGAVLSAGGYIDVGSVLTPTTYAAGVQFKFTPSAPITTATTLVNGVLTVGADGKLSVSLGSASGSGAVLSWAAGVEKALTLSQDAMFVYLYVDDALYLKVPIAQAGVGTYLKTITPLRIGYAAGTYRSLTVKNVLVTPAYAKAYYAAAPVVKDLQDRFSPQKGVVKVTRGASGQPDESIAAEAIVFVKSDGTVQVYYTGMKWDYSHGLCLATATHPESTYTKQGLKIGVGAVGNRSAGHAWGVDAGATWYIYATNAPTSSDFYLYSSTDEGATWTDHGSILNGSSVLGTSVPLGNITIAPEQVGGYYYGILEAQTGSGPNAWECYWIRSSSLTSGWTSMGKITTLQFAAGGGGGVASPALYRINDKWHCFYGYTGDKDLSTYTKNLPSRCSYASSTDGINWTDLRELVGLPDMPLGVHTDQTADPDLFEWGGKTYMFCSWMVNPPEENYNGALGLWQFEGTLSQLVTGLPPQ